MGKTTKMPTPSSKRSWPEDSPRAISPPGSDYEDILVSIDRKLSSLDARLSLVEVLHKEFQALQESLEFSQQQVVSLVEENEALKDAVKNLTNGMSRISEDSKR